MMNRFVKKAVPAALFVSMLAGCSFGGNSGPAKDEQGSIKVMYYDENSFFQEYGMLFSAVYPNIDVQVVNTQSIYRNSEDENFDYEKAFAEFIEKEQPDILMLSTDQYEKMAQEGKFYDLEAPMARDKYNTEGIVPGIIDYMKELGGGHLYGFPSSFYSQVLYYNKDLFDKYNITPPTDQMTWQEVIQLAQLFPKDGEPEDRIYGLKMSYSSDLSQTAQMLANSEGLSYVNPTTKQMTINTAGWKNAVQAALDATTSGALYFEDQDQMRMNGGYSYEDYLLRNPFLSGRLAMLIEGNYLMNEIKQAKDYIKEEGRIIENWDMVTMPVSTQNPDQSTSTWYNNIFTISEQSPNKDAAWNFIAYITGDEYARVKSKAGFNNGFPIRTNYIKDTEGRNFDAFYKLKPSRVQDSMYKDYDKLPPQFGMQFQGLFQQELQAIKDDKKTIDEALEFLQTKGEELLLEEPMSSEEMNEMMEKQMEEQRRLMQEAAGESISVEVAE